MTVRIVVFMAMLCAASVLHAAGPAPMPYSAVEVDRFVAAPGVAFPADYQNTLAEDIAREISLAFQTVVIVHQGEAAPYGHALVRVSGVVSLFKRFGAGSAVLRAQVWFIDAATGQVLLNREVKGRGSQGPGDGLAKKIAKLYNAGHLEETK
jgi:hypothetical protein